MTNNILSIPFRRTKPVPFAEKLTEFISSTLDQHPEQFRDDLAALNKLRADIVTLDVHSSSLERLIRYHAQLLALSTKLPVDVHLHSSQLITGRYRVHLVPKSQSRRAHP